MVSSGAVAADVMGDPTPAAPAGIANVAGGSPPVTSDGADTVTGVGDAAAAAKVTSGPYNIKVTGGPGWGVSLHQDITGKRSTRSKKQSSK